MIFHGKNREKSSEILSEFIGGVRNFMDSIGILIGFAGNWLVVLDYEKNMNGIVVPFGGSAIKHGWENSRIQRPFFFVTS